MEASSSRRFHCIGIFGSTTLGVDQELAATACDVGRFLAARNIDVIYAGGRRGVTGLVAAMVTFKGGKVLGVVPDVISRSKIYGTTIGKEIVVSDMQDQMKEIYDRADAFIVLPGGLETLQAGLQMAYWAQMNVHHKPVGVLNISGIFDGLFMFLYQSSKRQVMPETARRILVSAPTIEELFQQMQAYRPELEPEVNRLEWPGLGNDGKKRKLDLTLRL